MLKRIEAMTGHTVVCGMGRVGYEVCRQLAEHGTEFVVVDQCVECVERAKGEGWPVIRGDAAEDDALAAAGLIRAKSLVAALDTDADNVFVVLTARTMCPTIFIVARATGEASEPKLMRAGANRVLTPTVIGGRRMASMVLHPLVTDYLDLVSRAGEGFELRLEEVLVPKQSSVVGIALREAHLHSRFGAFVLAVQRVDGTVDAKPGADTLIGAGDVLILLGESAQLDALALSL